LKWEKDRAIVSWQQGDEHFYNTSEHYKDYNSSFIDIVPRIENE